MSSRKKAKRVPKPPSAKEIKKAKARAAMAVADAASDARKAELEGQLAARRAAGAPAAEIAEIEAAIKAVDREKADRHNEWNMEYDPYLPLEREDLLRLMAWLEAEDLARQMTRHSAAALGVGKRMLRGDPGDLRAELQEAGRLYDEELMATADAVEGLTAFLEKRKPEWIHR